MNKQEETEMMLIAALDLLQEIANDPKVDLVDSERRIRVYALLHKAGLL